jgi:chromosome segregation ATPase
MTDHKQDPDTLSPGAGSHGQQNTPKKKKLDTFFPTTWLLAVMVIIFVGFNIFVGLKVFSLQNEKAVVVMLKDRYESYGKMIRDIEEKQEQLRSLTAEVPPLEMRKDNAIKVIDDSVKTLKTNKANLDKILATSGEVEQKLIAMRETVAELSNDKQSLQREKEKLEQIVVELRVDQKRTEQSITKSGLDLRAVDEEIRATEVQLKEQQNHLQTVAAANSSFEELRKQLSEFTKKMDEAQSLASAKIKGLEDVIAGVAEQKNKLSSHSDNLAEETKNITQSNAAIKTKITSFAEQTKVYQSEVEKVALTSGEMKSASEAFKGITINMENDEAILRENTQTIKTGLEKMQTTSQELAQAIEVFTNEVSGVTSQGEKLDTYLNEVADLPDMRTRATSLQKVLGELESVSATFSETVSAVQERFDGKLAGMELSFGTLENDFSELSFKINGVEEILKKIAASNQEIKNDSNTQ